MLDKMKSLDQLKGRPFWDYLMRTVTAESERDVDYLLKLMNPSDDRTEMGEVYDKTLGYNPINYFDEQYLKKAYDKILESAPDSLKWKLQNRKEDIIEKVLTLKLSTIDEFLYKTLIRVIEEETGWSDADLENLSPTIDNFDLEEEDEEELFDEDADDFDDDDDDDF